MPRRTQTQQPVNPQATALRNAFREAGYASGALAPDRDAKFWHVTVRVPGDRYPCETVWLIEPDTLAGCYEWGPNFEHTLPIAAPTAVVAQAVIRSVVDRLTVEPERPKL